MTATQQDVILALLSLDAYNRGANAKLKDIDDNWLGEQVGTVVYLDNSDEIAGATAVGFSASCQRRSKNRPRGGVKVGHLWRPHETAGRA
jgi:hypothetical protein